MLGLASQASRVYTTWCRGYNTFANFITDVVPILSLQQTAVSYFNVLPKHDHAAREYGKSFIRQPDVVGTALSFTAVLLYQVQSTILSSRAEDAHQKVLNLASFSTSLFFELPSFQNEATDR